MRQTRRIIGRMGIRQALENVRQIPEAVAAGVAAPPGGVSAGLEAVVWSDVIGTENLPLTRAEAMKVPAVARARSLIVTTVAACDLAFRGPEGDLEPPLWSTRTDGPQSPYHRMLATADD